MLTINLHKGLGVMVGDVWIVSPDRSVKLRIEADRNTKIMRGELIGLTPCPECYRKAMSGRLCTRCSKPAEVRRDR